MSVVSSNLTAESNSTASVTHLVLALSSNPLDNSGYSQIFGTALATLQQASSSCQQGDDMTVTCERRKIMLATLQSSLGRLLP